jgi:hypothetical protein
MPLAVGSEVVPGIGFEHKPALMELSRNLTA